MDYDGLRLQLCVLTARLYVTFQAKPFQVSRLISHCQPGKVPQNIENCTVKLIGNGLRIFSLSRQPICAPRVYVNDLKKG